METVHLKIFQKLSNTTSVLYQESKPFDDFVFDPFRFWISASEFEILNEDYPFFSQNLLISGMLFCKSKKSHKNKWFRAKFFGLFKDYLVLYSVISILFWFSLFLIKEKESGGSKMGAFAERCPFTCFGQVSGRKGTQKTNK